MVDSALERVDVGEAPVDELPESDVLKVSLRVAPSETG